MPGNSFYYTPKAPVMNNLEHWLVSACFLSHGFKNYKIFSTAPHIILLTLSCSLARVRGRARFLLFLYSFFSSFFFILSFGSFLSFSSFSFFSFSFSSFLAFVYNGVGGQFWPYMGLYKFHNDYIILKITSFLAFYLEELTT